MACSPATGRSQANASLVDHLLLVSCNLTLRCTVRLSYLLRARCVCLLRVRSRLNRERSSTRSRTCRGPDVDLGHICLSNSGGPRSDFEAIWRTTSSNRLSAWSFKGQSGRTMEPSGSQRPISLEGQTRAQLILGQENYSPPKGRIHLRRLLFSTKLLPCSRGGPYIRNSLAFCPQRRP